jgi:cytochrome c
MRVRRPFAPDSSLIVIDWSQFTNRRDGDNNEMTRVCAIAGGLAMIWLIAANATAVAQPTKPMTRAEAAKMKNPVAATPESIAAGRQLFGKYCRFCHGASGQGDSATAPKDMKPSNLADKTWDRGSTDGEIYLVIQDGAGPLFQMKGLRGKITDQDTWHIVNFVRSLGGPAK